MKRQRGIIGSFAAATLALLVALPAWAAAPPAPWTTANIGDAEDAPGTVDVDADGVWTVTGSGGFLNDGDQDGFFFVHQTVTGDGTIIARLVEQVREDGTQPKTGIMVRADDTPGSPYVGQIMTTSTLSMHHRAEQDANNVRTNNVDAREFPRWMRIQRVGNQVSLFTSRDGRLWTPSNIRAPEIPLGPTALIGLVVGERAPGYPTTGIFDNVQLLPGVVSISGAEGAATDKMALLAWQPIQNPSLVGYNVYRGPRGAGLDEMTLLTATPQADAFFLDNAAPDTSLRDMSYVVAPVFKAADGNNFEGPAVRVR